jgi:hypothetical protein
MASLDEIQKLRDNHNNFHGRVISAISLKIDQKKKELGTRPIASNPANPSVEEMNAMASYEIKRKPIDHYQSIFLKGNVAAADALYFNVAANLSNRDKISNGLEVSDQDLKDSVDEVWSNLVI